MSSRNSYLLVAVIVLGVIILVGMFLLIFIPAPFVLETKLATSTPEASSTPWVTDLPFTEPTTSTTAPARQNGMRVVTGQDSGTTILLTKNEPFIVNFGVSLNWTVSFEPADVIRRVGDSTTEGGGQGMYEATAVGTTTMEATGVPICNPREACPQFIIKVSINFVVK